MRNTLKISYSCYVKNPSRPSAHYYGRVREAGKVVDIDLKTKVKAVAEAWVALRRSEVERYNQYVLVGEEPPKELEEKLVRTTRPAIAQKGVSEAVPIFPVCSDGWERELRRVGRREKTVAAYTRALRVIVPPGATTNEMTVDQQRRWLGKFDERKPATRRFYSVTLREFSKYCAKYHGTSRETVDDFVAVSVPHREKPHWTMAQMRNIIDNVHCKDRVKEQCYKAYFWVMATCGSRQSETYDLLWSDLDFTDPVTATLTFRAETTKNNQTRVVPLDWRIARLLSRLPHEGARMFHCIPRSQAARYGVLQRAIRDSKMPAGNLHTFRHSVSCLMYKSTEDIKATAQLLGHSPQVSMAYYVAARQADQLREVVDKTYSGEAGLPSPIDELAELDLL